MQMRMENAIQKNITIAAVVAIGVCRDVLQQQMTTHAELGGGGRGLTGVIRLHGTGSDDRVGALLTGGGHEKLELAGLVAAAAETRAVVPLNPELRAAQRFAQARQRL